MRLFLFQFYLNTCRLKQQITVFDGTGKRLSTFVKFTVIVCGFGRSVAFLHPYKQMH